MLKLIKSNTFKIGGLVIALAMVLTLGGVAKANAADTTTVQASAFNYSGVMKAGMSGPGISTLQAALNSVNSTTIVVDGSFGPATKKAVMEFQMAHVLGADGVVGPKTGAALAAATVAVITVPSTGPLCPNGMTLASNCMTAPGGTAPTGTLCPNGMTLASNCMTAPGSTTPGLSGPEGNLTSISKLGSYNNTKVSEGDMDVAVLGIQATAKDGSQNIDSLKVALYNSNGSSSKKISKYATNISVWLDGKKIGSKNVSEFSDDANDVYTYRFTGMNGVIPAGQQSRILVALSAVASMDSTDATNETWAIGAGSVVAGDADFVTASSANGRYNDFGPSGITATINFQKAGGVSSDQKFKVSTSSTNPAAQTIPVSRTADSLDKLLLAFDVKAENGAMKLQRLPVTLTVAAGNGDATSGGACATSTGTTCLPFTAAVVKSLKLYANGVKIADESVPQSGITDNTFITVTFGVSSKLQYAIPANGVVKFEVRADLNDVEDMGGSVQSNAGDFDEGDTVKVDYTTTNVTNTTVELDNINQDNVANRSGSATGEAQTARSTGVLVTMGTVTSDTPVTNTSGEILSRTLNIPVTVTAFDDTVYLARAVNQGTTVTDNTSAFAFTVEDSAGGTKAVTSTGTLTSQTASVSGSAFAVNAGDSKSFMISVTIPGTTSQAIKQYRVQLNAVQTYLANDLTTGVNEQVLTPSNAFETGYYTLTLN